jgi:predicted acyltransferase
VFFVRYASEYKLKKLFVILIGAGAGFLLAGIVARNFWIVNKISATPSWIFLCAGISVWLYVFLYWLVETKRKERWFGIIKPAGTATLTCYLVPDVFHLLRSALLCLVFEQFYNSRFLSVINEQQCQ